MKTTAAERQLRSGGSGATPGTIDNGSAGLTRRAKRSAGKTAVIRAKTSVTTRRRRRTRPTSGAGRPIGGGGGARSAGRGARDVGSIRDSVGSGRMDWDRQLPRVCEQMGCFVSGKEGGSRLPGFILF